LLGARRIDDDDDAGGSRGDDSSTPTPAIFFAGATPAPRGSDALAMVGSRLISRFLRPRYRYRALAKRTGEGTRGAGNARARYEVTR
jgi:hypothetical protein